MAPAHFLSLKMRVIMRSLRLVLTGACVIAAMPAFAQHRHHRHAYRPGPTTWQDDVIAEATARAQREPGLAKEIDPGSQQTATGGPVGGLRTPF